MTYKLMLPALLVGLAATPALAQDWQASMDYQIGTAQGLVLDSMNRSAARAGEQRQPVRRMTAQQRARNCAIIRDNLHRLTRSQMSVYRRNCT